MSKGMLQFVTSSITLIEKMDKRKCISCNKMTVCDNPISFCRGYVILKS